jgi:hypothetical protein
MSANMITRTWMPRDGALAVVFSLHRKAPPSDGEWTTYLEALEQAVARFDGVARHVRALSISDGGGPDAKQREQLKAFMRRATGSRGVASIVTADPIGRGIVKALSWFNPDTRGFAPNQMRAAIDYLGLALEQRGDFERVLNDGLREFPIESVHGELD